MIFMQNLNLSINKTSILALKEHTQLKLECNNLYSCCFRTINLSTIALVHMASYQGLYIKGTTNLPIPVPFPLRKINRLPNVHCEKKIHHLSSHKNHLFKLILLMFFHDL